MPATTGRKKDPVLAVRPENPLRLLEPDYPVKPWINARTAVQFSTVSFRQDDGSFAAFIAEDESVWAVGRTRREAEEKAKALYAPAGMRRKAGSRSADVDEDIEDDLRALDESVKGRFADWRDVRHKYAK